MFGHFGALSQVSERRNCSGKVMIVRAIASPPPRRDSRKGRSVLHAGRRAVADMRGKRRSIMKRVVRSSSVPIAELPRPRIKSPPQWPGTAGAAASAGRSLIMISGVTKPLPRSRVRALGTCSSATAQAGGQFAPKCAAALDDQGLVDAGRFQSAFVRNARNIMAAVDTEATVAIERKGAGIRSLPLGRRCQAAAANVMQELLGNAQC